VDRPPLRFASVRVVNHVLNAWLDATLKLQWREHVALAGEDGCYAGAGVLARRLGLSRDAVERGRRNLAELGLLRIVPGGPGRASTYFPTLPPGCEPSIDRPSPEEIARLAERLQVHIRHVRSGGTDAASPESEVAALVHPTNRTDAAEVAAPARQPCRINAATLAAAMPPVSAEKRGESGGTDAAARSPRLEVVRREAGELQADAGDRACAEEQTWEEYDDGKRKRIRRVRP